MFGIIDENKKFILIDKNRDTLYTTALTLTKKENEIVLDFDENGEKTGEHYETKYVPLFDKSVLNTIITEYTTEDIEISYNGDKYLKGFAPTPDKDYQSIQREKAYEAEVDPITAHIARLRDLEQTPEIKNKISELVAKRNEKVEKIKTRYPY